MSLAILDGTKGKSVVSEALIESLNEIGVIYKHLELENMNIKPCKSCGGCNYQTPGECVLKDDTPQLIRAYVKADHIITVTPISFGGYAATTKKALDKLALTALPTFITYKGRLQHPSRYPKEDQKASPINLTIAVVQGNSPLQQKNFEKLIKANNEIMMITNRLIFVDEQDDKGTMKSHILSALREVEK